MLNIQIFGFKNCQDTRKAQRFFAERFGPAALIDKEGARYKALGLRVALDSPQRLLDRALTEPRLLKTPLVRNGAKVTVGAAPADWEQWITGEKQA